MLSAKQTLRSSYPFVFTDSGDFFHGSNNVGVMNKNFQRDFRTVADYRMLQDFGFNVGGVTESLKENTLNTAAGQKTNMHVNAAYKLKPYWDSTLGITAGNRYIASMQGNGNLNVGRVQPDGSVILDKYDSASTQTANAHFFAETLTHLFVHGSNLSLTTTGQTSNNMLMVYDKAAKTSATLCAAAAFDYDRLIFDGIYGNFAIFIACQINATTGTYAVGYAIVDLINRVSKFVSAAVPFAGSFYLGNCSASQGIDSADGLSRYFFRPTSGATFSDPLRIERFKFSKSVVYADTFTVAANRTICTLAGAPADFVAAMRNVSESATHYINYVAHAFKDSGKTYVTVSFILGNTSNGASGAAPNLGTYVFRLESDEVTLTYVSKTMYGYGANTILPTAGQKNLIIASEANRCTKLQWVSASESYVQSDYVSLNNTITVGTAFIGVDRDENVYYTSTDTDIRAPYFLQVWNFNQGATVQAKVVGNPNVVYTGTPIEVVVALNAFDAFGARQARTVNLVLDGATFKTGGGTAQQFTTDVAQDTLVSILINQAGTVTATPVLV